MSSSDTSSKLTLLLPTPPYVLAYTLPLLFLSFLLTFAGTFLTLDRSRSFPARGSPDYSSLPGAFDRQSQKRRLTWLLEGGIGGLAIGYAFGLHLSTFLALLIPATTSSSSLSSKSFLAVWILSCLPTTGLAGRYRYAALLFSSIAGGTLASLSLCMIIHPSRLPRIVLISVFTCLLTLLALLSAIIPRLSIRLLHPVLRTCTSSAGAFGLVLSIALLSNPQVDSWANVWERLWVDNGQGWGNGKERGLSAAFAVFWIVGMASDWALNRWIGECPDEKWDDYLAKYAADLPNQADRAGTFRPLTTFWGRFFASPSARSDITFPSDKDMKTPSQLQAFHAIPPLSTPLKLDESIPSSAAFLKKSRSQKIRDNKSPPVKSRKPVKFGGIDELSSDSDSDSDDELKTPKTRPWALSNQQPSLSYSSTPTLVDGKYGVREYNIPDVDVDKLDYDKELANLKKIRGVKLDVDALDYSDQEEDLGQQRSPARHGHGGGNKNKKEAWSPGFMKRHQSVSGTPPIPGAIPVPATPSLIKAMDRIAVAQREAFGPQGWQSSPNDGLPTIVDDLHIEEGGGGEEEVEAEVPSMQEGEQQRAPRWEEFWREVRVKAHS